MSQPLPNPAPVEPRLSVVVPAHQGQVVLRRCLDALLASDLPRERWELVIVDDASTDDTSLVAAEYADVVVRLPGPPHGPAYARNRGVEASRGEILVFVDADVCVHPDVLRRLLELFDIDPTLSACFGSYDARPAARTPVSQYRNLLHHYVHHRNAGPAETFWAGLGAVRRDAFLEVGMFDEWHYPRPQIEDIELGRRLRRHGHRILLEPSLQGKHLKHWTLGNMILTDFKNRGVPWMWLTLQEGPSEGSKALNLRFRDRFCVVLTAVALVAVPVAVLRPSPWPWGVVGAAVMGVVGLNAHFYWYLVRQQHPLAAVAAVPLTITYYLNNVFAASFGWLAQQLLGEPPPSVEAHTLALSGAHTWPPAPTRPALGIWSNPGPEKDSTPRS